MFHKLITLCDGRWELPQERILQDVHEAAYSHVIEGLRQGQCTLESDNTSLQSFWSKVHLEGWDFQEYIFELLQKEVHLVTESEREGFINQIEKWFKDGLLCLLRGSEHEQKTGRGVRGIGRRLNGFYSEYCKIESVEEEELRLLYIQQKEDLKNAEMLTSRALKLDEQTRHHVEEYRGKLEDTVKKRRELAEGHVPALNYVFQHNNGAECPCTTPCSTRIIHNLLIRRLHHVLHGQDPTQFYPEQNDIARHELVAAVSREIELIMKCCRDGYISARSPTDDYDALLKDEDYSRHDSRRLVLDDAGRKKVASLGHKPDVLHYNPTIQLRSRLLSFGLIA